MIQTYSPLDFRGRAIALFHMTQVLLLLGEMLIGAPWPATVMSIAGTLCMIALYLLVLAARRIR